MIWKAVFVVALGLGVLCGYDLTDAQDTQSCSITALKDLVVRNFKLCFESMVDKDMLAPDIIAAATSYRTVAKVIKKFCDMSAQLKTCIYAVKSIAAPCIEPSLRVQLDSMLYAMVQPIDFACEKGGERIMLFVREHGPQCIIMNAYAMEECYQANYVESPREFKSSLLIHTMCPKYVVYTTCMIKTLKECSKPTLANIVEDLVRNSPCTDGAASMTISSVVILLGALISSHLF